MRFIILYPYSMVKGRMQIADFQVKLIVAETFEKSRKAQRVEMLKAKAMTPEVPVYWVELTF